MQFFDIYFKFNSKVNSLVDYMTTLLDYSTSCQCIIILFTRN